MNTKRKRILGGRPMALGTCTTLVAVTHLWPASEYTGTEEPPAITTCGRPFEEVERGTFDPKFADCPDCKRALAPRAPSEPTPQLDLFGGAR